MAKIIHARLNEAGQIMYGIPGDQTTKEVVKQDFYDDLWHTVYRAKERSIANHMVKGAEQIAANDHFGYGQDDRYTGYEESKKVNFDFSKVTTPCDFDCSSMIMTLIVSTGINVPKAFYTWNMHDYMVKTGQFEVIPYEKSMTLKKGDIVLKTGHVVMVVEGNENDYPEWVGECYGAQFVPVYAEPVEDDHRCSWPTLGTGNLFGVIGEDGAFYKIRIAEKHIGYILKQFVLRKTPLKTMKVTGDVYVRTNPGANFRQIGVLHAGEEVVVCDTKKAANGADWYFVIFGDRYGFSSARYIK